MKRLFVSIVAILFASNLFAQFSIEVGYNAKTITSYNTSKEYGKVLTNSLRYEGVYVMPSYIFNLTSYLSLQSGMRIDFLKYHKDYKDMQPAPSFSDYSSLSLSVPVRAMLKWRPVPLLKLGIFAGPSIDWLLLEKRKMDLYPDMPVPEWLKERYPNDNDLTNDNKRLDLLIGAGIYAELFSRVSLIFGYDEGLLNTHIYRNTIGSHGIKTRYSHRLYGGISVLF